MKDRYQLTFEEFKQLPRPEHDEFMSKLFMAVNKDKSCFEYAQMVVNTVEEAGMFKNVHFGQVPENIIELKTPLS